MFDSFSALSNITVSDDACRFLLAQADSFFDVTLRLIGVTFIFKDDFEQLVSNRFEDPLQLNINFPHNFIEIGEVQLRDNPSLKIMRNIAFTYSNLARSDTFLQLQRLVNISSVGQSVNHSNDVALDMHDMARCKVYFYLIMHSFSYLIQSPDDAIIQELCIALTALVGVDSICKSNSILNMIMEQV